MKKIMFNDRYGLTEAVLQGRKTVTRRELRMTQPRSLANCLQAMKYECMVDESGNSYEAPYYVGEIVAVAQSYKDCGEFDVYEAPKDTAGWNNKMFVRADLMPHQIRILDVRAERLQDITGEDCLREGVRYIEHIGKFYFERKDRDEGFYFDTAREAYARLIDKISGKGTWERNPYVWRIEFELVK